MQAWIQNVTELRRNGRIGQVLELGEPRFHAGDSHDMERDCRIRAICCTAIKNEIAIETAF